MDFSIDFDFIDIGLPQMDSIGDGFQGSATQENATRKSSRKGIKLNMEKCERCRTDKKKVNSRLRAHHCQYHPSANLNILSVYTYGKKPGS